MREVREENCRNAFSSFVICLVFTILLSEDNKDWEWLRQRYQEPAVYILLGTCQYGFELVLQIYAMTKFSIECNQICCRNNWMYIVSTIAINIWGAIHILDPRFEQLYQTEFRDKELPEPRMKGMVQAMFWLRFIGTIFLGFVIFCAFLSFCTWKCDSDPYNRNQNRKNLENLFVYLFPVKLDFKMRDYDA